MTITITNPHGSGDPVPVGMPVRLEATGAVSITWSAKVNSGGETDFATGAKAVYTVPSSVVNRDDPGMPGHGNAGCDKVTIKARDTGVPADFATIDLVVVNGMDALNYTNPMGDLTNAVPNSFGVPVNTRQPGGPTFPTAPVNVPLTDEDNEEDEPCEQIKLTEEELEEECVCAPGGGGGLPDTPTGGSGGGGRPDTPTGRGGGGLGPSVASVDLRAAGQLKPSPMFCPSGLVVKKSLILTSLYGALQTKSGCGCGSLHTRGETVDLGVYFSSIPDGIIDQKPAGTKRSFGWQVRVIKDLAGNVAIYWGDREIEGWLTPDGGSTFQVPRGTFGGFTKQADGTFTRVTKDGVYFDFDSLGKLQKIKDRSLDGSVIYYNYNAGGQMIRITGPGLGYKPYFNYDANARVNSMTLEATSSAENRTTYYDYDATGRMNKLIAPDGSTTYFDYNAQDNLDEEIDPDGHLTYFAYSSDTIPRIRDINLPEDAGVYLTYDDTVPRSTQKLAGDGGGAAAPGKVSDYQWAGLPMAEADLAASQVAYFQYCPDAKPETTEGTDKNKCYFKWDVSGQMTAVKCCDDYTQYFTYGPWGRVTSRKDELGRVTYWNYDAQGYQVNWIDPKGKTTYFIRDSFGQMTSMKDRRGNVTYYTYNARGNHTSTKWAGTSVRYYDYNAAAELEKRIDELGNVSYYDHDPRGRITKWKNELGQVTQYVYDKRSNRTIEIDRRGNAWYWAYDGLSRNTVRRTALLNTAYFNYTPTNLLASQVDPRGNPAYFYYDAEGALLGMENALKEITYYTYTPAGQVESEKDPRGCARYYTYDCHHRLTSEKDGVGNVTYYDYDKVDNLASVIDPRGNKSEYFYDELDRRIANKNPLAEFNYFYYDVESNTTTTEDALQRRAYFYYDTRNRQFCGEDAQKNRTYFTYTTRSERSSLKNARGFVTYFYQDKLARQFAARDPKNGVAYIEYDAESNQIASKTARGFTTYYTVDKDRRQESMKTPLAELTYYGYDAAADRTSVKDARGNPSYFYFDKLNRTFSAEDAKQARTYYTFDPSGNADSVKDPLARVTYTYYDCANRSFGVRNALGGLRYFTYDPASNQDSVKDERGNVTYSYYDSLNRTFATRDPVSALTYFTFDKVGNRTLVKDAVARLNYFYFDTLNRSLASEDGLGKRTYYTYDAVGNTVSIKDPRPASTQVGIQYFTYDALDRRNSFKNETANVWYYDYDADSSLSVQRNPKAALTYWTYDALDRKLSQKDPLARTWYWTYDAVGNVSSLKDGKAQVTYYQYDTVNLNDRIDYPDATKQYFEFDLARQRAATNDPLGRTGLGYDALGRMSFRGNPGGQNLYYDYDAVGNRANLKDPDGRIQSWEYDAANRMGCAGWGYGNQPYGTTAYGGEGGRYEYNLAGDLVHERRGNLAVSYYGYDAAGRVTLIQHRKQDGTLIERWDYTRDEVGNITKQVRGSDSMNTYWDYDQASRITKEAWRSNAGTNIYGWTYTYDAAGNRHLKRNVIGTAVNTYWNYDLADQMTIQKEGTATRVYFTYDANGNLSVEHDVNASAGRTYYDYEPRNLLTRVDFPGATATNYFYYNALGERIRKDDSTGGKKYTWDGLIAIAEKNLADSTTQRMAKGFTPIGGIGDFVFQEVSGTILYPHKNQVGTTLRHSDKGQVVVNTYEYDAWGQPLVTTEGTAQQYRYTGKELDPDFIGFNSESRRYHFPARFYLPFRAIFGQVDSLLLQVKQFKYYDGIYSYVNGQPTVLIDPLGLQGEEEEYESLMQCRYCLLELRSVEVIGGERHFILNMTDCENFTWSIEGKPEKFSTPVVGDWGKVMAQRLGIHNRSGRRDHIWRRLPCDQCECIKDKVPSGKNPFSHKGQTYSYSPLRGPNSSSVIGALIWACLKPPYPQPEGYGAWYHFVVGGSQLLRANPVTGELRYPDWLR